MTRILVIEDEVQIRANVGDILEMAGFEVAVAENGQVGLQTAREWAPDLILCDIMMPELDGYGVLAALRQGEATATIPVIFLTAKSDHSDLRYGMELGADDYLCKPFEARQLLGAIASRLKRNAQVMQQVDTERHRSQALQRQVQSSQKQLQQTQQMEGIHSELLKRISQDLRDPLSNINLAIHMLQQVSAPSDRDRYLQILQEECAREIQLLNEIENLQALLTPENAQLLQRFKLLS